MSSSRWLTWTPRQENIRRTPVPDPPKPPKPISGGFGGTIPWVFPLIHAAGQAAPDTLIFEKGPATEPPEPPKPTFEDSTPIEGLGAEALLVAARRRGVSFSLREDGRIKVSNVPSDLVAELQAHWDFLEALLRDSANPFSLMYRFPSCPRCGSFSLYRKDNADDYQCMSCDLTGIGEAAARMVR